MKRITAIVIVAAAIIGSSYAGAAQRNCDDVGLDIVAAEYSHYSDEGKHDMAEVLARSCESGKYAATVGVNVIELDEMLKDVTPEFRKAVTTGYSMGSK